MSPVFHQPKPLFYSNLTWQCLVTIGKWLGCHVRTFHFSHLRTTRNFIIKYGSIYLICFKVTLYKVLGVIMSAFCYHAAKAYLRVYDGFQLNSEVWIFEFSVRKINSVSPLSWISVTGSWRNFDSPYLISRTTAPCIKKWW